MRRPVHITYFNQQVESLVVLAQKIKRMLSKVRNCWIVYQRLLQSSNIIISHVPPWKILMNDLVPYEGYFQRNCAVSLAKDANDTITIVRIHCSKCIGEDLVRCLALGV